VPRAVARDASESRGSESPRAGETGDRKVPR
jgi:hypothetical protein